MNELQTQYQTLKAQIKTQLSDARAAMLVIRDQKLYLEEYATYDEFCLREFGISRRRGYQLCDAAEIEQDINVNPGTHQLPEKVIRPMAKLPREQRKEVFQKATKVAQAAGRPVPTVKEVQAQVDAVVPPKPKSIPAPTAARNEAPGVPLVVASPFVEPAHVAALKQVQRVREILDAWTGPYSNKPALGHGARDFVLALRNVVG